MSSPFQELLGVIVELRKRNSVLTAKVDEHKNILATWMTKYGDKAAECHELRTEVERLNTWVENDKEVFAIFGDFPDGPTLAQARALKASLDNHKWVSVGERLPPSDTFVLLWNGHWRGVGKAVSQCDDEMERWQDESTEFITPTPTHWMPLPDSPLICPQCRRELPKGHKVCCGIWHGLDPNRLIPPQLRKDPV